MNVMADIPRLTSVADALGVLLTGLEPVPAVRLGVREAIGLTAAETVTTRRPVPPHAIAQRSGIAVAAADLVGASAHAPVVMATPPYPVRAGEALPAGADAVLPKDAAMTTGSLTEISQAAYPGENATLSGADLADGATIVRAGETVTSAIALALELAGIGDIAIRCPRFNTIDPSEDGESDNAPHRHWLGAAVEHIGGRVVGPEDLAEAIFVFPDDPEVLPAPPNPSWIRWAGLALRPGGNAEVIDSGLRNPSIVMPPRFDGVVACFYALVLPLVARLTARVVRQEARPLTRKITSQVGFTDVALLRSVASGYEPLSVGQVTLSALLAADAVALIPPESEGAAAGTLIAAIPMHDPLGPA
jgi:molybdopterin molybdotransferase